MLSPRRMLCAIALASLSTALIAAASAERRSGLTLNSALQRALASNPKLAAADRDIGIAAGRYKQAGAIPNPELLFELDDAFGTGNFRGLDSAQTLIGLGQLIELRSKRE